MSNHTYLPKLFICYLYSTSERVITRQMHKKIIYHYIIKTLECMLKH